MSGEENSHSEEALLELLLTYAIPQTDVQPIAVNLLKQFVGLAGVLEAPIESLSEIVGINSNSVVLLKLVDWIRQFYSAKQHDKEMHKPAIQTNLFEDQYT